MKKFFDWKPKWDIETTVEKSVEIYNVLLHEPQKIEEIMNTQVNSYFQLAL